jgi:hypothetical protein
MMAQLPFGGDVWAICTNNSISANTGGNINFIVVRDAYLMLIDSGAGGGSRLDAFVLCHPQRKGLSQVFKLCQEKRVPIGFNALDAVPYANIFIIGGFSDGELLLLPPEANKQRLTETSGSALATRLRQLLNSI